MRFVLAISKMATLIGCGWSAQSAIALVAVDLLEWCREYWAK